MSLNEEKIKKICPTQDRILIKRIEEKTNTTPGGIFIPEVAKEKAQIGLVIAVGQGRINSNGILIQTKIKVGDSVFFGKFSGTEIENDYLILREDEVLATL